MEKKHLTGIVMLLVVAFAALIGAGVVAQVITPPGTVVEGTAQEGNAPAGPGQWPDAPALEKLNSGETLLSAAFDNDASLDVWQAQAASMIDSPAAWKTLKGKLVQNGNASGGWSDEETLLTSGDGNWTDYQLDTMVYATSGSAVGVVWRVSGDSMYRVRLFANIPNEAPKARLELVSAEGVKLLATAPVSTFAGYTAASWTQVTAATNGSVQQVWVNGVELFRVEDGTLKGGKVGVLATADGASAFDNVRVQGGIAAR